MAYNRKPSKTVTLLKTCAWLTENWFWIAVLFLIFSPVSPHILMDEYGENCTYLGSRGFVWETNEEPAHPCPYITLKSIN